MAIRVPSVKIKELDQLQVSFHEHIQQLLFLSSLPDVTEEHINAHHGHSQGDWRDKEQATPVSREI